MSWRVSLYRLQTVLFKVRQATGYYACFETLAPSLICIEYSKQWQAATAVLPHSPITPYPIHIHTALATCNGRLQFSCSIDRQHILRTHTALRHHGSNGTLISHPLPLLYLNTERYQDAQLPAPSTSTQERKHQHPSKRFDGALMPNSANRPHRVALYTTRPYLEIVSISRVAIQIFRYSDMFGLLLLPLIGNSHYSI